MDTNIVMINFGHLDRNGIAQQLALITKYQPKIIALDAFFSKDSLDKDSILVHIIKSIPNLVMVCSFSDDYEVESIKKSHPKFSGKNIAHNDLLATSYKKEIAITAFSPFIEYRNETYTALGLVLAKAINPAKAAAFLNKHSKAEIIPIKYHYPSLQFTILTESQLENEQLAPGLLKGKVVLLGFLGPQEEDIHVIPFIHDKLPVKMYGITIHAHIAHMILNDK